MKVNANAMAVNSADSDRAFERSEPARKVLPCPAVRRNDVIARLEDRWKQKQPYVRRHGTFSPCCLCSHGRMMWKCWS